MADTTQLACACGQVRLEVAGSPIIAAECHCTSCRTAGGKIEALPDAQPVLEANGGTRYVLYRKDRVRVLQGAELLKEFRLTPKSPTRRVVASCCNTPVFTEFQHGHWLSLYRQLWPAGAAPRPEIRTMVSDRIDMPALDASIPNLKTQSGMFFVRLLGAWMAMGFRTPKVTVGGGELKV
jgi:hypothetical protein